MKTLRKIIALLLFISIISGLIISGCRKSSQETNTERDRIEKAANLQKRSSDNVNSTAATAGSGCTCSPGYVNSDCNDCVRNTLMGGSWTKSYIIEWDHCDNPCNPTGVNTTIKFCYDPNPIPGECNLLMEIDMLPACLSCLTGYPACLKVKGSCTNNGNDVFVTGTYTDANGTSHDFSFTFGNDPKVTVCCNGVCCTGETL